MTDQTPTLFVPLDVAQELRALRADLAELRAAVQPIAARAEWQTVEDAALQHGVTIGTVNRWVRDGKMQATGSGRGRRVRLIQP